MKSEKLEVVRGSGNVFRDLGRKNPDAEQFKAILAAEIIKALDRERLTVRAAHDRTNSRWVRRNQHVVGQVGAGQRRTAR
jgi:hypothetical protein